MKTVYFVRHGEAENNVLTPGQKYLASTARLTERGREQARIIAERATKLEVDALIVSPFERTKETAQAISEKIGKNIEYSELFTERRSPASFVGRVWDDPETQRLDMAWVETLFMRGERFLDGENFDDITMRAQKALDYLYTRREQNILVVTHGFFLRTMVARVLLGTHMTPEEYRSVLSGLRTRNTGLTVFRYSSSEEHPKEEKWRMLVWNDHAHLG